VGGKGPKVATPAFVATNASLVGDVNVGTGSSVWYGSILRADQKAITIGSNSNIQDRVSINGAKIGNGVTVGSAATLDGCTIGDDAYIGMGATLSAGCTVGSNAMVGSASVLASGASVASGQYWSGNPAVFVRDLTVDDIAFVKASAADYCELNLIHAEEAAKTFPELEVEKLQLKDDIERDPKAAFHPNPIGEADLDRRGLIFNDKRA
jgi:carbonic anhydrase/acetyltransferase-like protein (isoleucine patch superfamily)